MKMGMVDPMTIVKDGLMRIKRIKTTMVWVMCVMFVPMYSIQPK